MKIKYLLLSAFMLALWSCETDMENPDANYPDPYLEIDSGDADFSTYVSMGGGLAAGWSDGSLFMASIFWRWYGSRNSCNRCSV